MSGMSKSTLRSKSGLIGRYEIEYLDGTTVTTQTTMLDSVRWEANEKKSIVADQTATAILQVVFYAIRREGKTDEKYFDKWVTGVAELYSVTEVDAPEVPVDEVEGVDPT